MAERNGLPDRVFQTLASSDRVAKNSLESGHQMVIYGDCFGSRKHAISGANAPNVK
jgi:hypothetical protein